MLSFEIVRRDPDTSARAAELATPHQGHLMRPLRKALIEEGKEALSQDEGFREAIQS